MPTSDVHAPSQSSVQLVSLDTNWQLVLQSLAPEHIKACVEKKDPKDPKVRRDGAANRTESN